MSVQPSRALQTMADILSRAAPSRGRTVNERMQADEFYKPGLLLRVRVSLPSLSVPTLIGLLCRSLRQDNLLLNLTFKATIATCTRVRTALRATNGDGDARSPSWTQTRIRTVHGIATTGRHPGTRFVGIGKRFRQTTLRI